MLFETITLKKEDNIAIITLNRPERLNAMIEQMFDDLTAAFDDADKDDEVRVVVITGAGRAFCAGADLIRGDSREPPSRETSPEVIRQRTHKPQSIIKKLQDLAKPTIAMINGAAIGGGFDVALACDLRVGSEKARFRVAFTRLGLIPGTGGTWLLPRVVGLAKAAELLFTGDFLEAEEAERIGLLNKLVPAEKLEQETMSLARKIASNPPISLRLDKLLLHKGLEVDLDTALEMIAASMPLCVASEDYKEGIAAFLEKRAPLFKGK